MGKGGPGRTVTSTSQCDKIPGRGSWGKAVTEPGQEVKGPLLVFRQQRVDSDRVGVHKSQGKKFFFC